MYLDCFSQAGSAIGEHVRVKARPKLEKEQNALIDFPTENIFQILTAIEEEQDINAKRICKPKFHVTKSETKAKHPQKENVAEETYLLDLPEHVIFEILVKIPAEDLRNVRCVCRK